MARPNPAWSRRVPDRPWCDHDDAELIEAVRVGAMVEVLPDYLGRSCGDILKHRLELIKAGRVRLADPI